MENINIKNLEHKDKMLVMKAISNIADTIYKENTQFILNQLIKNGTGYKSTKDLGKFWKSVTCKPKTVQQVIDEKYAQVEKLQNEIKQLETITDKTAIQIEGKPKLMSKTTATATDIAKDLLKDLLENLDSKTLNNSL